VSRLIQLDVIPAGHDHHNDPAVLVLLDRARVYIGTHVVITPRKIRDFVKPEEPDLLARTD
jgi:hypothetical protein